jgi:transcriptional regulator with GAF, ATPase, and Fis domain
MNIHCGAIPDTLIESELFGHEKGAFTGADRRKLGKFEIARDGTIFLDEVGTLSPSAQIKLLQVLQDKTFSRVGGTDSLTTDARVIAATNEDIKSAVEAGRFRKDLYYRLNVFPLELPPLSARADDIPMLVEHFLKRLNAESDKKINSADPRVIAALKNYAWPGNIRELENILERGVILTQNDCQIDSKHICLNMPEADSAGMVIDGNGGLKKCTEQGVMASLADAVAEGKMDFEKLEQELLSIALEKAEGNVLAAARLLGMTGPQCRYRLKKLNLI